MKLMHVRYLDRISRRSAHTARTAGQALVPVLFVVMILVALAVTMAAVAKRETRAASNALRESQAQFIAMGALRYAAAELEQASNGGTMPVQLTQPPDTDANGWTQLGEGWYKVEIFDSASRLNINTASLASINQLPQCIGDPSLAASIMDWRDADSTSTQASNGSGAESDYYQTLNPPYNAKNGPFDTLGELLMVRGISPELLYGSGTGTQGQTDINGNPLADAGFDAMDMFGGSRASKSRQTGGSTGTGSTADGTTATIDTSQSAMPLCELITTFSKEENVASDGTARLNIKTASATEMVSGLSISQQLAQRIVSWRGQSGTSVTSISDLMNVPGITRVILQQIGDKITVTSDKQRVGVININTAPAEVLATIPGVDQTIYNAVIEARQSGTVFTGLNDVFQLTSLNRQQLQKLVDAVCTKSSVYIVRVKVRMPGSNKIYAAQALVELLPPTTTTSTSGTGTTSGLGSTTASTADTDTSTLPEPNIWQFQEVPRKPGWSSWTNQGKINP